MKRWIPLLLSGFLYPTPSVADITLHYGPDGRSTNAILIEADDHGHIRATTEVDSSSGAPPGMQYFVDGDRAYMIDHTPRGPALARMEDVLAMAGEGRGHGDGLPGLSPPPSMTFRASPHGTARVGQWDGNLFWVERVPPNPHDPPSQVVISNDPSLARYGYAPLRITELQTRLLMVVLGIADDAGNQRMVHDLLAGGLLLRESDLYRLDRLSTDPIPPERFLINGPVLTRAQLRALHPAR
jgi:hypothetical protein